jgi:hypothetical protein
MTMMKIDTKRPLGGPRLNDDSCDKGDEDLNPIRSGEFVD